VLQVSSEDGQTYLIALEDTVIKAMDPLSKVSGEFLHGRKYEQAVTEGSEMFVWAMPDDEFMACFTCEPPLTKADPLRLAMQTKTIVASYSSVSPTQ
jgi:hypothetical protein